MYQIKTFSESHSVVSYSLWPHGLYSPWNSLGQNTGVGSLSLLQGIFPTQRLNPGLPHCTWILYQLSHQGSFQECLSLLQWIFLTQKLKRSLLHCRWILYQLSYQEKSPFNTLNSHNVTYQLYLSKAGGKRIEHILSTSKHISFHKGTNKNHFEKNTRILKDSFIIPLHQYFSWRTQKIMQVLRNTFLLFWVKASGMYLSQFTRIWGKNNRHIQ